MGWLSTSVKNKSNKNTTALFALTLKLDAAGLSRAGKTELAQFGLCLQTQTFSRLLEQHTQLYRQALFLSILQRPHAIWIDNYNRGFQHAIPNGLFGIYTRIDCTAFVLVFLDPLQPPSSCRHPKTESDLLPFPVELSRLKQFIKHYNSRPTKQLRKASRATKEGTLANPLRLQSSVHSADWTKSCLEGTLYLNRCRTL